MTQLSGAGIRGGSLRFGPVCPLIERRDPLRARYIAAKGLEHASSLRYQLAGVITVLEYETREIFNGLGIRCLSDLEFTDMRHIRQEILAAPCAEAVPQLFDEFVVNTRYVAANFLEGDNAEAIKGLIDRNPEREKYSAALGKISHFLGYLTGIFDERRLFIEGNTGRLTSSFDSIRSPLLEFWDDRRADLQIEDFGAGRIELEMSEHRLFSLFNNIISNAYLHGKDGEPIGVFIGENDSCSGIVFSVSNVGGPIPAELFELSDNGYPRIFALEEREGRIPIGMAEIWDIIAISKGCISVSTLPERTAVSVLLPGISG